MVKHNPCRYKFRVKSENDYGISEPGEESDPFDVGATGENRCVAPEPGNAGFVIIASVARFSSSMLSPKQNNNRLNPLHKSTP